ncbi:MAG: trypsin-like serine protease [Desertifilum sp.]|nr:trypsin-like serine protease [Desertifilum sp.]
MVVPVQSHARLIVASVTVLAATLGTNAIAQAGTIRHDRADAEYLDLATLFPSVGYLRARNDGGGWTCSGTLIDASYVLTAAHCVESPEGYLTQGSFSVGGSRYGIAGVTAHEGWFSSNRQLLSGTDIAILLLDRAVANVNPAELFRGTNEHLQLGTYVGYGLTGNGLTGSIPGSGGTKRAGQNMIAVGGQLSRYGYNDKLLVSNFSDPRRAGQNPFNTAQPLEYQLSSGDSGGGLFINNQVAGVHSFISDRSGGKIDSNYGEFSASVRVSDHLNWIRNQITNLAIRFNRPASERITSIGQGTAVSDRPLNSGDRFARSLVQDWDNLPEQPESVPEPNLVWGLCGLGLFGWLGRRKLKNAPTAPKR